MREVRRGFIPTYRGSRAERDQAAGGGASEATRFLPGYGVVTGQAATPYFLPGYGAVTL